MTDITPKEIKSKSGYSIIVDADDYEYLNKFDWIVVKSKKRHYATAIIRMHRLILNAPKGVGVDHKDRDGLNNQKKNLRLATNSQNARNRGLRSDNKTGYKGVHFNNKDKKFQVRIMIDNKYKYVGNFKTAIEAAQAYDEAATTHYKEFANLNFK